ncbi:transposable element Tcb1 transposase [Trichonephila clavipes]|nr:transposable element Tcb1 transposase [Trichonephila clavipes]
MHKMAYLNILQNNLKESADKLGLGSNFIFLQDNDPKHTAFVVEEWLLYHCRNQLNTLPQSPDLNVIDHLWSQIERSVQKHQITSKEQLKSVLQEEWLNIAPETTRYLMESMPRRLEAVISAKETGSVENKPRPGGPSKLTSRAKRMIVRSVTKKPMTSAQNIANELLCHHVMFQCLLRQSEMYCTALVRKSELPERNLILEK